MNGPAGDLKDPKRGEAIKTPSHSLWTWLRAGLQRLIQVRVWGMDIHPTARIATTAYIDRTFPKGIHIGADAYIGEEAAILTHDFTRGVYYHTRIGARCHVGPRAIVLPGLTIGDDCLLMPGALVTRDMPEASIALGNPAEIRPRDEPRR